MNIEKAFEIAPTSERTLVKNKYRYKGLRFLNDLGSVCVYRVFEEEKLIGAIKYYKGTKLTSYVPRKKEKK